MPDRVSRLDRGQLGTPTRTPQGYLRVPGWATRTGVLVYRNPDGSERRELRLPEEVSRADSLATLAQVPVTDEHPPQMLTAENTRHYQRGYTGETVSMDGDRVAVTVTLTDADLIRKAEAGQQELSCGYTCELELAPGVWQGQRYDAVQRNIVYNHLAVVPRGRAGPEVRLRLDAAEQINDSSDGREEGPPVTKIKIDGVEYEVSEAVAAAITSKMRSDAAAIEAAQAEAKKAQDEVAAEKKRADEVQAKLDAANDELKQRTDAAAKVPELVKARLDLERAAAPHLPADIAEKLDTMSDDEVRLAVIQAASPEFKRTDSMSTDYLQARYDAALEVLKARVDSTGKLREAAYKAATSAGERIDADQARQKFIEESRNAWKRPVNGQKES